MFTSHRIRSGNSLRALAMPTAPFSASTTSKPFSARARCIISLNHSSSSMTSMRFIYCLRRQPGWRPRRMITQAGVPNLCNAWTPAVRLAFGIRARCVLARLRLVRSNSFAQWPDIAPAIVSSRTGAPPPVRDLILNQGPTHRARCPPVPLSSPPETLPRGPAVPHPPRATVPPGTSAPRPRSASPRPWPLAPH